jgi:hypothetical protein
MPPWSLVEAPVILVALAGVLALAAVRMLREYGKLFLEDPKQLTLVEILGTLLTQTGGPGYIVAFLAAGSALSLLLAIFIFISNLVAWWGN